MSILIKDMEMPTDGNETIIRIQPNGTVLDQYGHHLAITAVSMPSRAVGDVVDSETYRKLLKAAKKMHLWIFLHSGDEQSAYDECELTPELNAMLGYGGQYELKFISKEDK